MANQTNEYGKTSFTPVQVTGSGVLMLRAVCFGSPIPLELLEPQFLSSKRADADTLRIEMAGNAFVMVLRFGPVIFWQCPEDMHRVILNKIQELPEMKPPEEALQDTVLVRVGQAEDQVTFKEILLEN